MRTIKIKRYLLLFVLSLLLAWIPQKISAQASETEELLQFPASYRKAISMLKQSHPEWVFVPVQTNVDWSYAVQCEMIGSRSLVYYTKSDNWKEEIHSPGWYYASREAVEYCMDPRNFLEDEYIFMFEQLTFHPATHTLAGVNQILQNSFMSGEVPQENISYAQLFFNVGSNLKVSPYHLACRVYQEQGVAGNSPLISGTYPGYEGYYNYFNVKASGTTKEEIYVNGLKYAKSVGWNSRETSVRGGSAFVSGNYILKGQDTLYLQKFDVDASYNGMFEHQYQQNITAPITEGRNIRKAYQRVGAMNNQFVFKIPVYLNMPEKACPNPDRIEQTPSTPPEEYTVRSFVERMYTTALGRVYDQEGLDTWVNQLTSKQIDGAGIAAGFIGSEEFRNRNLSDSTYIDVLYKTFFNRDADPEGKQTWLETLAKGRSRGYVLSGFVNSSEFCELSILYGIKQGAMYENGMPRKEGLPGYIERLYLFALDRMGDEEGTAYWTRAITSRTQTPEEVAIGFFHSKEFMNRRLSDEAYLETLYQTFLGRASDPQGKMDWLRQLQTGSVNRDQVLEGFARSKEFADIVKSFGL